MLLLLFIVFIVVVVGDFDVAVAVAVAIGVVAYAIGIVVALEPLHKLAQLIRGIGQRATSIAHVSGINANSDPNTDADSTYAYILGHTRQRRLMVHTMIVQAIVWSLRRR